MWQFKSPESQIPVWMQFPRQFFDWLCSIPNHLHCGSENDRLCSISVRYIAFPGIIGWSPFPMHALPLRLLAGCPAVRCTVRNGTSQINENGVRPFGKSNSRGKGFGRLHISNAPQMRNSAHTESERDGSGVVFYINTTNDRHSHTIYVIIPG